MSNDDLCSFYEKLFLEFAESLTDDELYMLGKTQANIYWDFDYEEFFLFMYGSNPNRRCFKVFDTTSYEDFDALEAMRMQAAYVSEKFMYVEDLL